MHQFLAPIHRRAAVILAPMIAVSIGVLGVAGPSDAAVRRVSSASSDFAISISPDAIRVDAGGVASFPIRVRSASRIVPKPVFDIDGLPDYIDAEIERVSSSSYRLNIYIPSTAPSTNGVYRLLGSANRRQREALFRVDVVGRVPDTKPPVTQPPVTQPPVTQPTIPAVLVPQPVNFNFSVDGNEKSGSTGETVGYSINVDRSAGYGGPVQFTLDKLPSTVQAGYLPNPTNGNTVLYLTPKVGTEGGRYVMTVIATAGSTQRAVVIALNVKVTGEFALLATPQSITRTTNGNAVYRLDIGSPTNDRPTVTYSADGVPNGTTVSFSANNTNAPTLNVTAAVGSATPNGTYNMVVTGKSGSVTKQVVLQLVVSRPSPGFSLAANPASLNLARNGSVQIALTVTPYGGFTGTINTGIGTLPTGVKLVSITNTSATVNQPFVLTITLAADPTAPVTSTVLVPVTSTSGTFSASVQVGIAVV